MVDQPPIPSSLIESTAEAIYRAAYNPDYSAPWHKLSDSTRWKYCRMAEAAIRNYTAQHPTPEPVPETHPAQTQGSDRPVSNGEPSIYAGLIRHRPWEKPSSAGPEHGVDVNKMIRTESPVNPIITGVEEAAAWARGEDVPVRVTSEISVGKSKPVDAPDSGFDIHASLARMDAILDGPDKCPICRDAKPCYCPELLTNHQPDGMSEDSVTFLEIVKCKGMPPNRSIMAPKWVFEKVVRGEQLTDDDLRFCVSIHHTNE